MGLPLRPCGPAQISGSMSGSSSLAPGWAQDDQPSTQHQDSFSHYSVLIHPGHHTCPLLKPRHLVIFASSLFSSAGGASPCGTHAGRSVRTAPDNGPPSASRVTWVQGAITASALTRSQTELVPGGEPRPRRTQRTTRRAPSAQPLQPSRWGKTARGTQDKAAEMAAPVRHLPLSLRGQHLWLLGPRPRPPPNNGPQTIAREVTTPAT